MKALDYVQFGVAQARRAWLGPDQVANTRTLAAAEEADEEVTAEIERKFLVEQLPQELEIDTEDEIAQGYLADR